MIKIIFALKFLQAIICILKLHCSLYKVWTQTTRAYGNCFGSSVYDSFYLSDICFPHFIASSVRVTHFNTKRNAFAADFTFCHLYTPPNSHHHNEAIITQQNEICKSFFKVFLFFDIYFKKSEIWGSLFWKSIGQSG